MAGRDACFRNLFANKKLFLFVKRPLEIFLEPPA
jgi:hypothetical protein